MVTVIVVAAGRGARLGGVKKQFLFIAGKTVLQRSIEAFLPVSEVDSMVVVVPEEDVETVKKERYPKVAKVVAGGKNRGDSVKKGFEAIAWPCDYVAVHDAARPFAAYTDIIRVIEDAKRYQAAVLAVPLKDTIKQMQGKEAVATLRREQLCAVQTPQVFSYSLFASAIRDNSDKEWLDDSERVEALGKSVHITYGSDQNRKITTEHDLQMAKWQLEKRGNMRIGHGYDVHRMKEGRPLILCGKEIAYSAGLFGHSDADVAVHALMDALLGAAALGDIGTHFPDTDPQYRGICSMKLLKIVMEKIKKEHWAVANVDLTILAEKPKLVPFIPEMRENLTKVLRISPQQISIKATTEEGVGVSAQGQAMAAHCVCLLEQI